MNFTFYPYQIYTINLNVNLIIDFSGFGHDLQEGTLKKRSFKHRFYDLRHCITYTNSSTKNTDLELRWLINSTHSYSSAVLSLSLSHRYTHVGFIQSRGFNSCFCLCRIIIVHHKWTSEEVVFAIWGSYRRYVMCASHWFLCF